MSSTEPPHRIPPRNSSQDTKANRDELTSKGKVEKVREVDADETRKRNFRKYFEEEPVAESQTSPSPFDLYTQDQKKGKPSLGASSPSDDDSSNEVEPTPPTTPPNVSAQPPASTDETEQEGLPQSTVFWEEVDLPDQPIPPTQMKETPASLKRAGLDGSHPESSKTSPQKKETSLFGPPGKPVKREAPSQKEGEKLPSPFETTANSLPKKEGKTAHGKQKKAEKKEEIDDSAPPSPLGAAERKERDRGDGSSSNKGHDAKAISLEVSNLPPFPGAIQSTALAAVIQASPYIHPSTVSLFFQMVGTMAVLANPRVQRTEIILNNRSYANSKFYGATITIEKYATAPDSFNIKLTGTNAAVNAFKENIPSLMNAFQNGNFSFRVNRLDVEYNSDRPVYRRKEKGEGRGETGNDGLGERRKE